MGNDTRRATSPRRVMDALLHLARTSALGMGGGPRMGQLDQGHDRTTKKRQTAHSPPNPSTSQAPGSPYDEYPQPTGKRPTGKEPAMTRSLRPINWAALGSSIGSAVLF